MARWMVLLLLPGFLAGCRDEQEAQALVDPGHAGEQVAQLAPPSEASTEDVVGLIAQLGSAQYAERVSAALRLGKSHAPAAATALLTALKEECALSDADLAARPLETCGLEPAVASGLLKRAYVMGLREVGGQTADVVRASLSTAQEPLKSWLIILLGYFGDQNQFQKLARLVRESEDGFVRANAVRALGHLDMQEAVPVLRKALNDPFVVEMGDVRMPLVRECARAALKQLGVLER